MDGQMFPGVVQQSGADAHLVVVALQDVEVAAALAALPELRIVREFGEGDRPEAEFIVHLHHGGTRGDGEDLGIREEFAREDESLLLDAFGDAHAAEFVRDDEAGIGDETLSAPGLDVGKTGELSLVGQGNHRFAGENLLVDVLRGTVGDTGFAFKRGNVDFPADFL